MQQRQKRQTTRCGPLVTLLIVCFFTADVFGDARTGSELLTGNAATSAGACHTQE